MRFLFDSTELGEPNSRMSWFSFKFPGRLRKRRWEGDRLIILDFNRSLSLIADPESLMASTAARVTELFRVDRVIILRPLAEPGILTVAFDTESSVENQYEIRLLNEGRLAKWMLTNEAALVLDKDTSIFNYLDESERKVLLNLKTRVCVPLITQNRLSGIVLLCCLDKDWVLSEYEVSLLQMLMGSASVALENAFLLEEQRDRLRKLYRAERLAAAGQLAASVAHEIRNPLTGIRSTVQYLVSEYEEGSSGRELLTGVMEEVDRIDRTIDGLLGLTRSTEFNPAPVDLCRFVEEILVLITPQALSQGVEIDDHRPSPVLHILADILLLRQLFINLILNALQAMPKGGKLEIEVAPDSRTAALAVERSWARVSISDTGCGIPADQLDRVFDPFFTTKKGGTGLGLYTTHLVAQQHGAEIEILSQVNEGTTVSVRFPIIQAQVADIA
jgi:signal transduction histidine kinase